MHKNRWLPILIILGVVASLLFCTAGSQETLRSGEQVVTKERQQSLSPQEIIERFKEGNRRFLSGKTIGHNYLYQMSETASAQFPPAIVLSCIDSRVSPEIVFDLGLGDIFDARVAGNIVNKDIAGSMEYACKVTGSKVVLVMGHTSCGAIKGAIDGVELGNLTGLIAKLKPAVDAVGNIAGERTSKNKKLVDAAARENIQLTVKKIRSISPLLHQMERDKKILITGCLYDVRSGQVEFLD
jgi:carbonic anhydrase